MLPARLPTIRTTHWRLRKSALIVSGRGWPSSTTIRLGVSVHGGAAAFQDSVRARGMVVLPGGLINITEDDFNSGKVHARDILEQLRAASAKVIVLVVQPYIQRALYAWSFDNDVSSTARDLDGSHSGRARTHCTTPTAVSTRAPCRARKA